MTQVPKAETCKHSLNFFSSKFLHETVQKTTIGTELPPSFLNPSSHLPELQILPETALPKARDSQLKPSDRLHQDKVKRTTATEMLSPSSHKAWVSYSMYSCTPLHLGIQHIKLPSSLKTLKFYHWEVRNLSTLFTAVSLTQYLNE